MFLWLVSQHKAITLKIKSEEVLEDDSGSGVKTCSSSLMTGDGCPVNMYKTDRANAAVHTYSRTYTPHIGFFCVTGLAVLELTL